MSSETPEGTRDGTTALAVALYAGFVGVGVGVGATFGLALDNLPLGVCVGLAVGGGLSVATLASRD